MGLRNALYGAQFRPRLVNGASFTPVIPHDLSFYILPTDFGWNPVLHPLSCRIFPAHGSKRFYFRIDRVKIFGTFLPSGFTAHDAMVRNRISLFRRWGPVSKIESHYLITCCIGWCHAEPAIHIVANTLSRLTFVLQPGIAPIIRFCTSSEWIRVTASPRKMFITGCCQEKCVTSWYFSRWLEITWRFNPIFDAPRGRPNIIHNRYIAY